MRVLRRHQYNLRSGKMPGEDGRGHQPVHLRHLHIHDDQVGLQLSDCLDGLDSIPSGADHFNYSFLFKNRADHSQVIGRIVDEQYAKFLLLRRQ